MDTKQLHEKAFEAMKKAVEKVVQEHKEKDLPLVIWKDGKVVLIDAKDV